VTIAARREEPAQLDRPVTIAARREEPARWASSGDDRREA
jgi:hypothetical protein